MRFVLLCVWLSLAVDDSYDWRGWVSQPFLDLSVYTHTKHGTRPAFAARQARDELFELAAQGAFTWSRPQLQQPPQQPAVVETKAVAQRPS